MSSSWKRVLEGRVRMSTDMPVDVLPCSNGEFLPGEATADQLRIMALQNEKAEEVRRRLGMSRRDFVRSAAAYGVGLWAIGQVAPTRYGKLFSGASAGAAPPSNAACDLEWKEAQLNNLPGEFIFDVQSHHVDSGGDWRVTNPGFHAFFAAIWEQSGPLGGRPSVSADGRYRGWGKGSEVDPIENLSRYHYIKELYLDSSTNMTVLSAVPTEESKNPLPCDEAAITVASVNQMADSQRAVMHAFVMPNRGSYATSHFTGKNPVFMKAEFEQMERHAALFGDRIRGWKVYTPWGDVPYASGWFLDDHVGLQFVDQVRHLGDKYGLPKVIACHKGFALPSFDQRSASPRDIGPAARQYPDVNFIVYHSGFDGEAQAPYPGDAAVNSADRGVNSLIKSLRENSWDATRFVKPGLQHGNVPNVYAEIGATFRTTAGRSPDQMAHLLGKLITYVGPQRVVWGTDSLWFGSPQSEIVYFRSFEFSDQAKALYNLPYGLNGDRFDPMRNALDPNSYTTPHPAYPDWPTDGKAHPERTIRNGAFGRNAAVPYQVDPDQQFKAISCDDVQKVRDAYVLNPATPREVLPGAHNRVLGARSDKQLLDQMAKEPFLP
jgi:uncharacterized protein